MLHKQGNMRILLCLLVMAIISGSGHAEPSAPDRLILVSKKSYERTVQQLQWELGGYGMTTVTALDYGKILKTNKPAGVRGVVFEVLRRQWATAALKQDPAAILEMPLRIAVYEQQDGKTVVSCYRPSRGFATYGNDELANLGRTLDAKLEEIVGRVTAGERASPGR